MGRINIRRTLIVVALFLLGFMVGKWSNMDTVNKVLKNETIKEELTKPTTAVTTNNKVELKKNKGSLVFAPTTNQSHCDSVLQIFIDTTSIKEFRKEKKRLKVD